MKTQSRWANHKNAFNNNAIEDRKLQIELNRINTAALCKMGKINEEMVGLRRQLLEERKILGTRSGIRADSSDTPKNSSAVGCEGEGKEEGHHALQVLSKMKHSSLRESTFRIEKNLNPSRVLVTEKETLCNGQGNTGPQTSTSVRALFPCSQSSKLSRDNSSSVSLTRRASASLGRSNFGSSDFGPNRPRLGQRRFSLPGHMNPPESQTTSSSRLASPCTTNKADPPHAGLLATAEVKESKENITRTGHRGFICKNNISTNKRRHSLPICSFHEHRKAANCLLTAKLSTGTYSRNSSTTATSSQQPNPRLKGSGKTAHRAEYAGKKPAPLVSSTTKPTQRKSVFKPQHNSVPELVSEREAKKEEGENDDDHRPSDDPELRDIPNITLTEKMQRFFVNYVEGECQAGVDFEQLLMEYRRNPEEKYDGNAQEDGAESA